MSDAATTGAKGNRPDAEDAPSGDVLLEGRHLSRSFGSTRALDDVSLTVRAGECLGLVGRNGAGKSTLVSILTGLRTPDTGEITFSGRPAPPISAPEQWRRQVACVYQHSMLVGSLSIAENVFLNRPTGSSQRFVSWSRMRREAAAVLAEWNVDVDVRALASTVSVEQRQLVEIARALSVGTKLLILDEPTAALERSGVEGLFGRIRPLLAAGVGIVYISHHLEEVYEICDRVMVVRDGRHVVTGAVDSISRDELVAAMVGDDAEASGDGAADASSVGTVGTASAGTSVDAAGPPAEQDGAAPDPSISKRTPVLRLRGLTASSSRGRVRGIDLDVTAGECVGLLGLRGSGSTVVADAVAGLVVPDEGLIEVDGSALPFGRPDVAVRRGVGYVPEDRHDRGFVPLLGVGENITATITDRLTRWGVLSPRRRADAGRRLAGRLDVVSAGQGQPVGELSGGNQQKVVVGRALARTPRVVVAVGPTQGVDVASKESLLSALTDARTGGAGVLLVTDDLDDLAIATRIVVVVRGEVFAEFDHPPFDREDLIAASEGLDPQEAAS